MYTRDERLRSAAAKLWREEFMTIITKEVRRAPVGKPVLTKAPEHVAIIMDGNGRWAKQRGLPRSAGHRQGTENLRRIIRAAVEFGVPIMTIYAFSTENWSRPRREVRLLMRILEMVIDRELQELNEEGVQIRHIGELDGIEGRLARKVAEACEYTRENNRLILNVAFNYGGARRNRACGPANRARWDCRGRHHRSDH